MPVRKSSNKSYELHDDFRALRFLRMPRSTFLMILANFVTTLLFYVSVLPKGIKRKTFRILMRDGYRVKIHQYFQKGVTAKSTIFYFAGGGFIMKPTHLHQSGLCRLAERTQSNVFLIRYRLAPLHPYPKAFEDALDATLYFLRKPALYGINTQCFGVCGDSAGGNLSAALCLYMRDHDLPMPKFEMLLYPAVTNDTTLPSRIKYTDTPMLDQKTLAFIFQKYYADGIGDTEKYAYPLKHPDLHLSVFTYVEACEFDPLHDEALLYHEGLVNAGSKSELHEIPGAPHGFDAAFWSPTVQNQLDIRCDFIRKNQ